MQILSKYKFETKRLEFFTLNVLLFFIFMVSNNKNVYSQIYTKDSCNHVLSVNLFPGYIFIFNSTIKKFKGATDLSYSYFLKNNIKLELSSTFYKVKALSDEFDKTAMFNINLLGKYYINRLHLDLGYHTGNFIESKYSDSLNNRPNITYYASLGIGFTFPIKKSFVFDISYKKMFLLNKKNGYSAINPGEVYFSFGYILQGNNNRFKKDPSLLKIKEILVKDVGYVYGGISFGGVFNNGLQDFNLSPNLGYRRFLKDKISVNAGFIPSIFFSKNDSIFIGSRGYLPRKLNTFDVSFGGRYHFYFLFVGLGTRIGTYSNFKNWNDFDRKVRVKLELEWGAYLRINNYWLLEFRNGFSYNTAYIIDKNTPTSPYFFNQMYIVKKLRYKDEK
jgi:hypothetical protein